MSWTIDVTEEALSSALYRIERQESWAQQKISFWNGQASEISSRLNSLKGRLNVKIATTRQRISSASYAINKLKGEISTQEAIIASCRPGQWVTHSSTDSDGNVHTWTEWYDPDAAKREAAQAKIAELEGKLSRVEGVLSQLESLLPRFLNGAQACDEGLRMLGEAGAELSKEMQSFERGMADINALVNQAQRIIGDYQGVFISGASAPVEELPGLTYVKGGFVQGARPSLHASPALAPSGPLEIVLNGPYKSQKDLIDFLTPILKSHPNDTITALLHRDLHALVAPLNLGEAAKALEGLGFASKRTAGGTRFIDARGHYIFTKR